MAIAQGMSMYIGTSVMFSRTPAFRLRPQSNLLFRSKACSQSLTTRKPSQHTMLFTPFLTLPSVTSHFGGAAGFPPAADDHSPAFLLHPENILRLGPLGLTIFDSQPVPGSDTVQFGQILHQGKISRRSTSLAPPVFWGKLGDSCRSCLLRSLQFASFRGGLTN